MRALVLESNPDSPYGDDPTSYEFPSRYLRFFSGLSSGEPLIAVIYEPRGLRTGRMAYIGWASITDPPEPSRRTDQGQWWRVKYVDAIRPFPHDVPREVRGEPLEALLREAPRGRARNVATFGRAIRPLAEADLQALLKLAFGSELDFQLPDTAYPPPEAHGPVGTLVQERTRHLVEVLERDARFQRLVFEAYDYRCAISGLTTGRGARSRLKGLVDAAHIRPVASYGPDTVANGLALTPTLHRLFDAGLFTVRYQGGRAVVSVSQRMEPTMIASPDGSFRMPLVNDLQVSLPSAHESWPSQDQLRYHNRLVFQGPSG